MNKPPQIPIETWQFFQAGKSYLGIEFIQKLYKISSRQIDRWCSDPDYTDSNQKNPQDRLEAMLTKLMALGHEDVAKAAVRRMVRVVGCVMVDASDAEPDKETLSEECLDDYGTIRVLHQAMMDGEHPLIVQKLKEDLVREVEESQALYLKNIKRK